MFENWRAGLAEEPSSAYSPGTSSAVQQFHSSGLLGKGGGKGDAEEGKEKERKRDGGRSKRVIWGEGGGMQRKGRKRRGKGMEGEGRWVKWGGRGRNSEEGT
jgi:hypothetical protein